MPEGVSQGHTLRGITRDLRDVSVAVENRILEIATRQTFMAEEAHPFEYCCDDVLSDYFGKIHYH